MDEKKPVKSFVKNIPTSHDRTLRIELVGGCNEGERHLLEGLAYFAAGTLSKDDASHTKYVADLMAKLIKHICEKMDNKKAG